MLRKLEHQRSNTGTNAYAVVVFGEAVSSSNSEHSTERVSLFSLNPSEDVEASSNIVSLKNKSVVDFMSTVLHVNRSAVDGENTARLLLLRSMSLEALVHILQDFDSAQIAVSQGFHNVLMKLSLRPVEFRGFVSSRIMLDRRHDLLLRLVDLSSTFARSYYITITRIETLEQHNRYWIRTSHKTQYFIDK